MSVSQGSVRTAGHLACAFCACAMSRKHSPEPQCSSNYCLAGWFLRCYWGGGHGSEQPSSSAAAPSLCAPPRAPALPPHEQACVAEPPGAAGAQQGNHQSCRRVRGRGAAARHVAVTHHGVSGGSQQQGRAASAAQLQSDRAHQSCRRSPQADADAAPLAPVGLSAARRGCSSGHPGIPASVIWPGRVSFARSFRRGHKVVCLRTVRYRRCRSLEANCHSGVASPPATVV